QRDKRSLPMRGENGFPLLWHMRDCFDLKQELLAGQSSYFNQCACRRVDDVHIAIANLAQDGELRDVHHVHIQLDYVGKISPNRSQRCLEIFKDLVGLRTEILRTDDLPSLVKSDLTSDKDGSPTCYLNHMGIAWRWGQRGWIQKADVGWINCHGVSFL